MHPQHIVSRRAHALLGLVILLTACGPLTASPQPDAQPGWKAVPGHITTRWAKDVDPAGPLPEYPRPAMVRERWQNLNGLWNYTVTGDEPGASDMWDGHILVPFPIESALSGVKKTVQPNQVLHYRRSFQVPADWLTSRQRVRLNFGAVDWHCKVRVNGKPIGEHTGGYDPFSFDITDALNPIGDNELIVIVADPTNAGGQPRGKQWSKPHGIWYTPTTGIWQTVWLEPVPYKSIASIRIDADRASGAVRIHITDAGQKADTHFVYEAEISIDGKRVAVTTSPTSPLQLFVNNPRPWSTDSPTLYDLTVRTYIGARKTDEVKSYFAFRDIKLAKDAAGINRFMLNGKPIFMFGPLDQGFWPDGLYTAPTDEALRFDIEAVIKMGGNMLRKHVKVEPQRFYYWCDRLGVLVWQDMPSPFFEEIKPDGSKGWDEDFPAISDEWKAAFHREWKAIIDATRHHPSIVMWVPFNEGWGQNDLAWAKSMVLATKERDPTRLVNNASGWTDMKIGDTMDVHIYPGPAKPANEETRAAVLGEYGGLGLPIDGHTWVNKDNWGYVTYKTKEDLTQAYIDQVRQLPLLVAEGLCAAVYTQTTDVEIETNGWLTYDREIWKINPDRARAATVAALSNLPAGVRTILPHAGQTDGAGTWRYTLNPLDGWFLPDHPDAANWTTGRAGFGTKGTPGAAIGTEWSATDIYLRREFDAPPAMPAAPSHLSLSIHHDEDATVFINGVLAADLKGYTTAYKYVPVADAARLAFKPGAKNLIAIHCKQTTGGQYIDCGLIEVHYEPKPPTPSTPTASSSQLDVAPGKTTVAPRDDAVRPREIMSNYESRSLLGFSLKINNDFQKNDPALLDRVLIQLGADLDEIAHFVPKAALDALRGVTIWIEHQGSQAMGRGGRGMCCHWSPAWLASQGLLTEKAGGIEIINPADFLSWRRDQPYMCFHELAHAYHWRLAKLDPEIEAVFQEAKAAGLYDQVARNSLPAGATERAYAITNSHEYFAELSEAYFALNDFYPYSRRQLAAHDPDGLKLMERTWNLSGAQITANTMPRERAK